MNSFQAVADIPVNLEGQVVDGAFRHHRGMKQDFDPYTTLFRSAHQVVVKTVVADKWRERVWPLVPAVTDGDRLDRNARFFRRAEQQAMHWQYRKPGAGGAFGESQRRFASLQVFRNRPFGAPGLASPSFAEQCARMARAPAACGPGARFRLGKTPLGGLAAPGRNGWP